MNWPSARSSRASWPFSTTKREPDSFAAVSKSIRPSASPISKCSFGASRALRGSPTRARSRRCRARRRRPARRRAAGWGSRRARRPAPSSASRSACLERRHGAPSARATSAISACARASSFLALAWPISFESALRRSCAACSGRDRAPARRRRGRSAAADSGSSPRFAQAVDRRPAGFSRMHRMSCMGRTVLDMGAARVGRNHDRLAESAAKGPAGSS